MQIEGKRMELETIRKLYHFHLRFSGNEMTEVKYEKIAEMKNKNCRKRNVIKTF